jgi:hypothetical protein
MALGSQEWLSYKKVVSKHKIGLTCLSLLTLECGYSSFPADGCHASNFPRTGYL